MSEPLPTVSVVVATRNRAALVSRMLDSAAAQDVAGLEVVVVDDGSDADPLEQVRVKVADLGERFRLLSHGAGHPGTGPSAARNRGIQAARGRYIAFCDDDDTYSTPDHLSLAVRLMQQHNAGLWLADMRGIRDGQVSIPTRFPDCPELTQGPRVCETPAVYEVALPELMRVFSRQFPHLNTVVVQRELLEQVGGFLPDLHMAEDINLLLRLADAQGAALYRDQSVADFNLTAPNSQYKAFSQIDRAVQIATAADRALVRVKHPAAQQAAASIASWSLRQAAGHLKAAGQSAQAKLMLRRAVALRPSLGAIRQYLLG